MAKVDVIELIVNGETHKYNVNVGKKGIFKCSIDVMVAKEIGLKDNSFEFSTLDALISAIIIPYHAYLESKNVEETFIWIKYTSCGAYAYREDGSRMFSQSGSPYSARASFSDVDTVGFEFGVMIKQTRSTGVENWYEARRGEGCINFSEGDLCDPDTWYKDRLTYVAPKKMIPYTKAAYDTLCKGRDGIRRMSEMLFDFIDQDEKLIESSLLQGNLLNSGNDER